MGTLKAIHYSNLKLGLKISIAQIVLFSLFCNSTRLERNAEDEIFRRYKPLAMDESITVVKKPMAGNDNYPSSDMPVQTSLPLQRALPLDYEEDIPPNSYYSHNLDEEEPLTDTQVLSTNAQVLAPSAQVLEPSTLVPGVQLPSSSNVLKEVGEGNATSDIFRIPNENNLKPSLTRLITGTSGIGPTFAAENITLLNKPAGSNIIARYRVVIPIYIPALKVVPTTERPTPPPVLVKEVHTKMVPVRRVVPKIKTVVKAERIPQQIVTDYVKADGVNVPSHIDDKLKPNEQVLKTVVTNFD